MYLLFAYDHDSPQGGAHDCVGVFETAEQARAAYTPGRDINEIAEVTPGGLVIQWEAFPRKGYTPPLPAEWRAVVPPGGE